MTVSIQVYRQNIGSFNLGLKSRKTYWHRTNLDREPTSFRSRFKLSLFVAIYSFLVVTAPIVSKQHQRRPTAHWWKVHSVTAGCEQFQESFHTGWRCAAMASYIWDPGSGTLGSRHGCFKNEGGGDNSSRIFSWLLKVEINKLAHIIN